MYHKLAEMYRKMDEAAEARLAEQRDLDERVKKAMDRLKLIQSARRKARKLSNRYKVGAKGYRAKSFIHRHKAVAWYLKLKKMEAQPYITALEAGVTVRTSLCRLELRPQPMIAAKVAEIKAVVNPFDGLPEGENEPIRLLPDLRSDEEKAARVPSILTKRKRNLPVIPEHQQMLASFMVWLVVLGTVSYTSTVAALSP